MRGLGNRLDILERQVEAIKPPREVKWFIIEGAEPDTDKVAFLRSQGHEIGPDDFCIIHNIVGWKDGKPVHVPLRDITQRPHP